VKKNNAVDIFFATKSYKSYGKKKKKRITTRIAVRASKRKHRTEDETRSWEYEYTPSLYYSPRVQCVLLKAIGVDVKTKEKFFDELKL
jgi:hypothetical protein